MKIIQRTTISAFLLLLMPLTVWLSGWTWKPEESNNLLIIMSWITKTGGYPWEILTIILFNILILWYLRFRLKTSIFILLIINITVLIGQYTKSYIKEQVREPRPYVIWLSHKYGISESEFYKLKRPERSKMLSKVLANDTQLPEWLKPHWIHDTGFSFPSGHSTFAVSWTLLLTSLLWSRRYIKTSIILFIWAIMVMASRLLLGMHWPRDLVMSTLISWLLAIVAIRLIQCFCDFFCMPLESSEKIVQNNNAS